MPGTYVKDGFICGDNPNYHQQIRNSNWSSSDPADNVLIHLALAGGRGITAFFNSFFGNVIKKLVGGVIHFASSLIGLSPLVDTFINNHITTTGLTKNIDLILEDILVRNNVQNYINNVNFYIHVDNPKKAELIEKFHDEINNPHYFHASILLKRLGEHIWDRRGSFFKLKFDTDDEKKAIIAAMAIQIIFTDLAVRSRNSELNNAPEGREFFLVPGFSHFMNSISKYSTYKGNGTAIETWDKIGMIAGSFEITPDEQFVNEFYENNTVPNQNEKQLGKLALLIPFIPFLTKS
ncbi:MAG: hypothetical protein ACW972_03315 [Promethearchaeota archaeon]|jgi:hypothetical protein